MQSLIQFKKTIRLVFIPLALTCFAISPNAQAVVPPPDGGYPGGNTAEGFKALFSLDPQDGGFNTAVGYYSLAANVNGSLNTAVGAGALDLNTSHNNTAVGAGALLLNTTGTGNTATGAFALVSNGTGDGNTATGGAALSSNITGAGNTAVGARALLSNDGDPTTPEGSLNTAVGLEALTANTTGAFNTAVGGGLNEGDLPQPAALGSNTTGSYNTAVGSRTLGGAGALGSNTTGESNTAIGAGALRDNTTGSSNTAVGFSAGRDVLTASNVISIGAFVGGADVNGTTWIGGVYNVTTQSGMTAPVIVSDGGQLGTVASSERFKKDIATIDEASEAILSLRPVTFHYKTDTKGIPQFGLIAEEVAKVNPALVLPDKEGKPYTVRYDQVNAMLLNEFLKEHRKVEKLEALVALQRKDFEVALTDLKGEIQRVSAQLELNKPAPQVVNNP
jgi:hypothetical protein